jgi:hypothetical protein
MPLLDPVVISRAVENVATWGDTDVFPLPIENHVMHDQGSKVTALLCKIDGDFESRLNLEPVENYSTLAPVGYVVFRWATQIDPVWNAYLLSLVISLGPEIERARIPETDEHVYSYRYREAPNSGLFAQDSWKQFQ